LTDCAPTTLANFTCNEEIRALSPNYYEIYDQSQKAEKSGWKAVAGPGFRKALEFLVKDYACKMHPGEIEKIKKAELGACIQNYMVNNMVRETAKRAAWLGNDETHYTRKWEDKDLQDLKSLISLVEATISSELIFEKMKIEMPEGKK